jgi:hypothetical protein
MAPPKKTHCKYGHEFTPENTHLWKDGRGFVQRKCKKCRRQADYERYRDKPHRREAIKRRAYEQYHGSTA